MKTRKNQRFFVPQKPKKFFREILIILGLILVSFLTIAGCKIETSTGTSFGLTIQDAFFAELGPKGETTPVDNIFKQGDKVDFVLQNVGEFKKGEDGLNWYDMDLEMKDSEGNIIVSSQEILKGQAHTNLPNNIATSPYTTFTANLPSGEYKIKLTIYDKISGASASKSKSFIVE